MFASYVRRMFGRHVNSAEGYSLRVRYDGFPGMSIRYVEGERTMKVFGELMANLKDLHLDLTTFGHWQSPHDSEPLDQAVQTRVLNRIILALGHVGYRAWLLDPETRSWRRTS